MAKKLSGGHPREIYSCSALDSYVQEGSNAKEIDFIFGSGAEYVHSCVAVLNGEFHVFGGKNKNKQHSVLVANGCKLKRDGELPMPFVLGTYATFMFPEEKILMCFTESTKKLCYL